MQGHKHYQKRPQSSKLSADYSVLNKHSHTSNLRASKAPYLVVTNNPSLLI